MGDHAFEQRFGAAQVVVVILERLCHAFADLGIGGEVDHALDPLVFKQAVDKGAVADIALVKARARGNRGAEAGFQVIRDNHFASGLNQRARGVRADIARAAQNKNRHKIPSQ